MKFGRAAVSWCEHFTPGTIFAESRSALSSLHAELLGLENLLLHLKSSPANSCTLILMDHLALVLAISKGKSTYIEVPRHIIL